MADRDYYIELYTVIDAAEDGKIQLWEEWPFSDYWDHYEPKYYTEKEFLWHRFSPEYHIGTTHPVKFGINEWRHRAGMDYDDDEYYEMIEYKKKSKSLCNHIIAMLKEVK
jgi:hypothetical protein